MAIEHEDIFIRVFHDSLEGGCKEWVNKFPPSSIYLFIRFFDVFLDVWTNKKRNHVDEDAADHLPQISSYEETINDQDSNSVDI